MILGILNGPSVQDVLSEDFRSVPPTIGVLASMIVLTSSCVTDSRYGNQSELFGIAFLFSIQYFGSPNLDNASHCVGMFWDQRGAEI